MTRAAIALVAFAGALALGERGESRGWGGPSDGAGATAAPADGPPAMHFSHATHAKLPGDVKDPRRAGSADGGPWIDRCELCHDVDGKGMVVAPAALGHSPCLNAGCHAADFLGTSERARQADPARYERAAAFCRGCHDTKDGAPPAPWQRPTANAVLQSFQLEREYHVEMNHFEHTQRAACRSCHVVDGTSFALIRSAPGHAQCVACHNPQKFPQFTMKSCVLCHDKPARAEFFAGSRPKIDVRACGGEGHAAYEARFKRAVSCFRHERTEHRTADGAPLSCAACHYMVGDRGKWGGRRYQTLRDLHIQPVIDNAQDREHKSCGRTSACHQADVDAARPRARCSLCHAERSAF